MKRQKTFVIALFVKKEMYNADRFLMDCAQSPSFFVRSVFGVTPSADQEKALEALAVPGAKISIRSGHRCGKTSFLAWAILYFLAFHEDSRVPCTAPSAPQLYDILWPEIAKWKRSADPSFQSIWEVHSDHVFISGHEKDRFAVARTARPETPEALQGFQASNMLFILDEASGIAEKVYEVAEGALASANARLIMTSNPTRISGYFFDSQTKRRSMYKTFHWSSLNSPFYDREYIETMRAKYGDNSNVYRVRVLGEFPTGGDDVVIPLDLIVSAQSRDALASGIRRAGLDVARFGDDATTLIVRATNRVTHIERWAGHDTHETCNRVMARFRDGLFDQVAVDTIGVGAGVADSLRHAGKFPVIDVDVSRASVSDQYNRLRDELWFRCADWFRGPEATLPREPKDLIEELTSELCGVTFAYTPGGKLAVESKDVTKERIKGSPDLADGLCLTFAEMPAGMYSGVWAKGRAKGA